MVKGTVDCIRVTSMKKSGMRVEIGIREQVGSTSGPRLDWHRWQRIDDKTTFHPLPSSPLSSIPKSIINFQSAYPPDLAIIGDIGSILIPSTYWDGSSKRPTGNCCQAVAANRRKPIFTFERPPRQIWFAIHTI